MGDKPDVWEVQSFDTSKLKKADPSEKVKVWNTFNKGMKNTVILHFCCCLGWTSKQGDQSRKKKCWFV